MSSSKSPRIKARWLPVAAIFVAVVFFIYWTTRRSEPSEFVTAPVTRGPIVRAVTATGTVNPVTVVQVGTYVSGPIVAIYVDFNAAVKAGQLMAKIDPRPFAAQVDVVSAALGNARAQLLKDRANLAYQKITYVRDQGMLRNAVISQDQLDSQRNAFEQAAAQVALDEASIQQQEASLRAAKLNLHYTNIISPVDGTVVSRNADVGQTVAASYQTPTLFLVAKDLTKMQVDTNVSESDIGGIRNGQTVDFTVDAYTKRIFSGTVTQVRKAPITVQNVVTYDVVVSVSNPELLLLPGMTANITIVTQRRDDVLRVPLRALAFSPRGHRPSSVRSNQSEYSARVWVENGGRLHPVRITRGLDDGNYVAVLSGDLKLGDDVIVDRARPAGDSGRNSPASARGGPHLPHM